MYGLFIHSRWMSSNTPVTINVFLAFIFWITTRIQFVFSNSPVQIIYASHMKENKKSEKILLNLGFTQISIGKKYSISRKEEVEDINYKLLKS